MAPGGSAWKEGIFMKSLIVLLGAMGVSMSPIFVRYSTAPSMVLVLYRAVFAAVLFTPYVLAKHREELRAVKRRTLLLGILSGIFMGLQFVTYFESIRKTSIAAAAVLVNTEALFVTLGTVLFMHARLKKQAWLAIALTFAGSIVVALADAGEGTAALGNMLALLGAIFGAAYTMTGTVCRRSGLSALVYSYIMCIAAAVTVLVCVLISGTAPVGYAPVNYLTTLGMALCCTIGGHTVYSWALKFLSPSFVSTVKMMEPVFASIWGLFLFGEVPGLLVIVGSIFVIGGIALYSRFAEDDAN